MARCLRLLVCSLSASIRLVCLSLRYVMLTVLSSVYQTLRLPSSCACASPNTTAFCTDVLLARHAIFSLQRSVRWGGIALLGLRDEPKEGLRRRLQKPGNRLNRRGRWTKIHREELFTGLNKMPHSHQRRCGCTPKATDTHVMLEP